MVLQHIAHQLFIKKWSLRRLVCKILANYDDYRHCIGGDNFNLLLVRIFIYRIQSKHDNDKEDRIFEFFCVRYEWDC